MSVSVTRTIKVDDLSPEELAAVFVGYFDAQQAEFFNEVYRLSRAWSGTGWCGQACSIAPLLDAGGRSVVTTLAGHIADREVA
ncbi:MAG TPA: hypothetical protein VF637_12850 [Sphingomicrobium sp.]